MKRLFLNAYLFLIVSLLFVQFILGPIINHAAKIHLQDSITEYNRQLAKGAFHMIEIDLMRLPEDQWQERIRDLKTQFGYKIALLAAADLSLTETQRLQMKNGEIVVVDGGELLYQRIGASQMVLAKGPFSVLEPNNRYFNLVIWLAVIIIIGLLTFISVIPYWRQLRKISDAASAFGNGEFSTRVHVSKISNLSPLAIAFNTMAERIQHLINAHKELTNAVSHELRTPLSRLRFGLELLETTDDGQLRSHYARGLRTDVLELDEMVTELLTFARFDREKPELHFGAHHLEPFLHQVISESIPEDSPILCRLHYIPDQKSTHVYFEPKYMARALGNLLQNAARYAEKVIEVRVERSGGECLIHIDDDGPGIAQSERAKVFEPFTRLDVSRSKMSGGYGLGLAIVARILKWHDGRAEVSDGLPGGARFTVRWPGFREEQERFLN